MIWTKSYDKKQIYESKIKNHALQSEWLPNFVYCKYNISIIGNICWNYYSNLLFYTLSAIKNTIGIIVFIQ